MGARTDNDAPEPEFALVLSVKRRKIPVKIDDREYELREPTSLERDAYLEEHQQRFQVVDGVSRMTNFKNVQAAMITRLLYDDTGRQVPMAVIGSWPPAVQGALFRKCVELMGQTDVSVGNL